jgi:hypothetical protein
VAAVVASVTVVAVAVAVAAPSTVVASATSPARRSLSTKRVDLRELFGKGLYDHPVLRKVERSCSH